MTTPQDYLTQLTPQVAEPFNKLRNLILTNLPQGFTEQLSYGYLGFVVPHSIYPAGYHCNPQEPVPFMGLDARPKAIHLHHMGLYVNPELNQWFLDQWAQVSNHKLDHGKSCFRFKYLDEIPYDAIGELAKKYTVEQWIGLYEGSMKK